MEMNEYLDVFIEESKEHIQALNDHLLTLEKNPEDVSIVNEIFRSAHTLKGMSATMGYQDLADLTHKMENVLDAIRNNKVKLTEKMLDIIFQAVDALEAMVLDIIDGGQGKKDVKQLVNQLEAMENGESVETTPPSTSDSLEKNLEIDFMLDDFELTVLQQSKERGYKNYQVTVTLQETCLLKAARVYMVFEILEKMGEVIKSSPTVPELEEEKFDYSFTVVLVTKDSKEDVQAKINKVSEIDTVEVKELAVRAYDQDDQNVPESIESEDASVTEIEPSESSDQEKAKKKAQLSSKTIRVNIDRLDALMNLFEELVIDRGRLEQISTTLKNNELQETVEHMSRISGDLQNIILKMRMVPVDQVFNRFPRMVRQLAKDLNKDIDLQIFGAETELDRTVIDEIGDPLVHLIRNALDHGIETPSLRESKGKSPQGTLKLNAYHSGNHVFIEISDDGAGIDREKVLKKAIGNGVLTLEESKHYSDQQVFQLIMASGFSTADEISDISGRGVGLDVVKNTIESLGGSMTIDSKYNEGSTFVIQLPLTLSIISVMLTEVKNEKYAIPLSSIIETAIVNKKDILSAHHQPVIDFRGRVVPLVSLTDVFDVPGDADEDDFHSVVIIRQGEKMAGLIVDSFIGQQEVVLKSLGNYLTDVFAISGATILGDGQVALIVDTDALIK
ncbi:chemotaxis protein CheA [Halolactibacillus alkaliphilus]|uniref:Chemotaxis protein CheA n=1 Tax=Halolactibacillus alkaliphilus TaxID=442899 RepID=A0A511WXF5_9BACI|nr:chemotaxis protein CheA [Halolactibacillus alkaliphilus]GEN55799.1 chemotaxis protein CheA [Halolactibacillus alkaliphilus]GGN64895.1 chemotaxis protein CheA [Halolactibacillus alkaliphilus]SFO64751.1 two-component system, chemotaxis family, sensor kinase CheA [Halolactibacillus alkaliphilus]